MKQQRAGFTLVELLVVIAIIGILVSLLLPAVQAAREAARRTECINHMRQWALATHNYHDQQKLFPIGNYREWQWRARVLPYLEQENLHNHINYNVSCYARSLSPLDPCEQYVKVYFCASDPNQRKVYQNNGGPFGGNMITTNYLGNFGTGTSSPSDGIFYFLSDNGFYSVTDGSSNTFLLGERGIPDGLYWGWALCGNTLQDGSLSAAYGFVKGDGKGTHDAHYWSWHPGGANFAMTDGSVRFISYTINFTTFQALATRGGGEVVSSF